MWWIINERKFRKYFDPLHRELKEEIRDLEKRLVRLECTHPESERTFKEYFFGKLMWAEYCTQCGKTLCRFETEKEMNIAKATHFCELATRLSKEK